MTTCNEVIGEVTYDNPDDTKVLGKMFMEAVADVDFRTERLLIVFIKEKIHPFNGGNNGKGKKSP